MVNPEKVKYFEGTLNQVIRGEGSPQVLFDVLVDMGSRHPLAYTFFWENPQLELDADYREGVTLTYSVTGLTKIDILPAGDPVEWLEIIKTILNI